MTPPTRRGIKNQKSPSPPLTGGDKGEGETFNQSPPPYPPPSRGRELIRMPFIPLHSKGYSGMIS